MMKTYILPAQAGTAKISPKVIKVSDVKPRAKFAKIFAPDLENQCLSKLSK